MSRRSAWAALASLLAGLWIFLVYRSKACAVNVLARLVLTEAWLDALRGDFQMALPWRDFWVYQLPGGLWVFAATLVSWRLRPALGNWRLPLRGVPVLVATGFEVVQALGWTDGTPDTGDVVSAWAGCALACLWMRGDQGGTHRWSARWQGAACAACHAALFLADKFEAGAWF